MSESVKLERRTSDDAWRIFDQLRDVYAEVYAEPPYEKGEDDVAEFRRRFDQQRVSSGFTLITACDADELAGFAYGFAFGVGRWWRGALIEPPGKIKDAAKFAVIELVLRRAYRGKGLGRQMMDELLIDRPEPYATLLSNPKSPARQVYERWGWRRVGTVRSYPHWPASDALVLALRAVCTTD